MTNSIGPVLAAALDDFLLKKMGEKIKQLEAANEAQAAEIARLMKELADAQALVSDCAEYLKPGETPRQRMDRDQKDILDLMNLLRLEKVKVADAQAERKLVRSKAEETVAAFDDFYSDLARVKYRSLSDQKLMEANNCIGRLSAALSEHEVK